MSAVVSIARVSAAFKVALVLGYLLSQANVTAEHLSSSCSTLPHLISTSLSTAKQSQFSLHASLRPHRSIRPIFASAPPTLTSAIAATVSLDLDLSLEKNQALDLATDIEVPLWERASAPRLKLAPETTPLPHILSWLEGWRMDIEKGLFRPLRLRASRFAFAYTDIFDTRGHPDKGSHGLGFLFRYDFRRAPDRH